MRNLVRISQGNMRRSRRIGRGCFRNVGNEIYDGSVSNARNVQHPLTIGTLKESKRKEWDKLMEQDKPKGQDKQKESNR